MENDCHNITTTSITIQVVHSQIVDFLCSFVCTPPSCTN